MKLIGGPIVTPEIDIKSADIEKVSPRLSLSDWITCV